MQGPRTLRHVIALSVGLAFLTWLVGGATAASASANGERIDRYQVALRPATDGSMQVEETIEYNFGTAHRHGIERTIPLVSRYDARHDREYPIDHITASSPTGAPAQQTTTFDPVVRVRIGDPNNNSVTGRQTYVIRYQLHRVVTSYPDHQEVYWNPVGTEWKVPITAATVTVSGPVGAQKATCFQGARGSKQTCPHRIDAAGTAHFTASALTPGQGLTVVAAYPSGSFTAPAPLLRSHWTWGRAFSLTPATIGSSLLVFLLLGAGSATAVLRKGRDEQYLGLAPGLQPRYGRNQVRRLRRLRRDPIAVRFTPPDDISPGQLGTLMHERARTVDVTATVIDMAVRGFIRIDQLKTNDWRLTKLPRPSGPTGRMGTFEDRLFYEIFRGRDHILLSQLRRTFRGTLRSIEARLELDVTERGWFKALPSRVRRQWAVYGILLAATGATLTWWLAAVSSYGLLGIAVLLSGLVLLALSPRMPARTAKGTAMLAQAKGFQLYLEKSEANQIRFDEGEDVFSRYLPYAIVLEVADRWAQIFAERAATGATVTWYSGAGLTSSSIVDDLRDFSYATSDALDGSGSSSFSSPSSASSSAPISASGLSGGGSTGGGGGGGGGGSW